MDNNIFHNEMLISALLGWLIAQLLKFINHSIRARKIELYRLSSDGGMPSCHSSMVAALATSAGLCYGFASGIFAIAATVAIVVMHDASGIRQQSGKHAEVINELLEHLKDEPFTENIKKLKEVLGHTHLQVTMGCLTGICVALLFHLILK